MFIWRLFLILKFQRNRNSETPYVVSYRIRRIPLMHISKRGVTTVTMLVIKHLRRYTSRYKQDGTRYNVD